MHDCEIIMKRDFYYQPVTIGSPLSFFQVVSGDFCECDNFSCDRYNGKLCAGEDHGECICGRCHCNPEYDVPGTIPRKPGRSPFPGLQFCPVFFSGYTACECRASNDTCITPYGEHIGKLCSGHGSCECGECKCAEIDGRQYSGTFCEECPVGVFFLLLGFLWPFSDTFITQEHFFDSGIQGRKVLFSTIMALTFVLHITATRMLLHATFFICTTFNDKSLRGLSKQKCEMESFALDHLKGPTERFSILLLTFRLKCVKL